MSQRLRPQHILIFKNTCKTYILPLKNGGLEDDPSVWGPGLLYGCFQKYGHPKMDGL